MREEQECVDEQKRRKSGDERWMDLDRVETNKLLWVVSASKEDKTVDRQRQ